MGKLNAAFTAKDVDGFEQHAKVLQRCLENQEKILSSNEAYYIEPEMELARQRPQCVHELYPSFFGQGLDNAGIIRQRYSALDMRLAADSLVAHVQYDVLGIQVPGQPGGFRMHRQLGFLPARYTGLEALQVGVTGLLRLTHGDAGIGAGGATAVEHEQSILVGRQEAEEVLVLGEGRLAM